MVYINFAKLCIVSVFRKIRGESEFMPHFRRRGVAQLVARTAGGREVAGSSPVTPTMKKDDRIMCRLFSWPESDIQFTSAT